MATEVELKRGRELFRLLIQNNGYEISLLPFLKKYADEDQQEYSFETLLKYIKIYRESDLITPKEIHQYKKMRSVSKTTLKRRGREICDTLIANKFSLSSLEPLALKYANEDKRYLPYSTPLLDRIRKYYLQEADAEYLEKYQATKELSKRSTANNYDFETIKRLMEFKSTEDACAYLNENGISLETLRSIRNAYFQVYPKDDLVRQKIDDIEEMMLTTNKKEGIKKRAGTIKNNNNKAHQAKVEKFKKIFLEYTNSKTDNLYACLESSGVSSKTFADFLKTITSEEDEELLFLYNEYLKTDASFVEERRKLAKTIEDYYVNGVYYGYENRTFSLYDLYNLTDKKPQEIAKILRTFLSIGTANKIIPYINTMAITKKYHDKDEFLAEIKYKFGNVDKTERDAIIAYMESRNWPYSLRLFKDIWTRLTDGLITIPCPQDKKSHRLYN